MPRFKLRLPFSISVSLKRRTTPPHPVRLAATLIVCTLFWQALILGTEALFDVSIGDTPVSQVMLVAVIAGGSAAVCRETWSVYLVFLVSGFLCGQLAPWAGLLPAAAVVLCRIAGRARVAVRRWHRMRKTASLSTRDKVLLSLHVEGRPGFWRALQAWVGWTRPRRG
jgi:hypothetical protein